MEVPSSKEAQQYGHVEDPGVWNGVGVGGGVGVGLGFAEEVSLRRR